METQSRESIDGIGHWFRHWIVLAPIPIWIALVGTFLTSADLVTATLVNGALIVYAIAVAAAHRDMLVASALEDKSGKLAHAFASLVSSFLGIVETFGGIIATFLVLSSWVSSSKYKDESLAKVIALKAPVAIGMNVTMAAVAAVFSLAVVILRIRILK